MATPILSVPCKEPEGTFNRTVHFAPHSIERLRSYWENLSQFPTLFNQYINNVDDFIKAFVTEDERGVKANGLVWEVDDVGIFYLTDIYPGYQATGHFAFWDRRFRGREMLIREMLKYVFDDLGFHRIVAEVPLYSNPTMKAVERVGFIKEGRLRKAAWYQGEWWDVNIYSVLDSEIDELVEVQDG